MWFGIINVTDKSFSMKAFSGFQEAQKAALGNANVEHGLITENISIVVFEYSLFVPPEETKYFSVGRRLYAGNALLYACNEFGETVDFNPEAFNALKDFVRFYDTHHDVERSIGLGWIVRPTMVGWRWPGEAPWMEK